MLICQVIELKPTAEQVDAFRSHSHAARIARNDVVALWREEGRRLPGFRYKLVELRPVLNQNKFTWRPWFAALSQNAVKGGMIDAQDAIKRYYDGQNRRPRFHRRNHSLAFRADNGPGTVQLDGKRLTVPAKAGGPLKTKEPLRWPGKVIRECRIKEKAGRWYASVRVDLDPGEYPHKCGQGVLGLDLGLKTFATIAYPDRTVEKVDAPQPFKQSLKALRRAQRRLSRRQKGSNNRRKARMAVAKRHSRMANIRKDFLHKLSHQVTAGSHTVQVESLSVKGWQRRWGRKTSDLAPAEFLRQLEYKADWKGGAFLKADRRFPSSQICHACGEPGGRLALPVRRWVCRSCDCVLDRDDNAALNIRDWPGAPRSLPVDANGKTSSVEALAVEAGTVLAGQIRPDKSD